jgi:hypothetical protein
VFDSKLFGIVVLISSLVLFNTASDINEAGLRELSLTSHLPEFILSVMF